MQSHPLTPTSDEPLRPLVIVGPSGVGKGTLIEKLREEFPTSFGFGISHTTRSRRGEEQDGVEYYFVSESDFSSLVDRQGFVEHATVHAHRYGTSIQTVQSVIDSGKVCLLDIDIQGAEQVHSHPRMNPFTVFVKPPSIEELEKRLRGRGTDEDEQIRIRMGDAVKELQFGEERRDVVDCVIVNDDLDVCYQEFSEIVKKEYEL